MTKRVAFTFDDRSYNALQKLAKANGSTQAAAIRDALAVYAALGSQYRQGFTEIIVRNPVTGDERVIVALSLEMFSRSADE